MNITNNPSFENPASKASFDQAAHEAAMIAKYEKAGGQTSINTGILSVNARSGEVTQREYQSSRSVGQEVPSSGSLLSVARTQAGSVVTGDIQPNHLIDIPGVGQTTVAAALAAGILARDASGRVIDPSAGAQSGKL